MNRILTLAFGGIAVVAASTAYGQETGSLTSGYLFDVGPGLNGSLQGATRTFPLLTPGDLNIRVWAPVEPHYNADANRDPAAEPFWSAG